MAATAQLNARLDPTLKAAGDEALALLGLSPTQAVRALWEKAARRGQDLEQVAALLIDSEESQRKSSEIPSDIDDEVSMSWSIVEEVFASHGLSYLPWPLSISDDDLLERELLERLEQQES